MFLTVSIVYVRLLQFRDDKFFGFLKCVPAHPRPNVCFLKTFLALQPKHTQGLAGALVSGAT